MCGEGRVRRFVFNAITVCCYRQSNAGFNKARNNCHKSLGHLSYEARKILSVVIIIASEVSYPFVQVETCLLRRPLECWATRHWSMSNTTTFNPWSCSFWRKPRACWRILSMPCILAFSSRFLSLSSSICDRSNAMRLSDMFEESIW